MAYRDIAVLIDGAIDDSRQFEDNAEGLRLYNEYLKKLEQESNEKKLHTEVYELFHDHEPFEGAELDDVCLQFKQDHHPTFVFN